MLGGSSLFARMSANEVTGMSNGILLFGIVFVLGPWILMALNILYESATSNNKPRDSFQNAKDEFLRSLK